MSIDGSEIDSVLAAAMRGEAVTWPIRWSDAESLDKVNQRILYHGIAGLLFNSLADPSGWPSQIIQRVHQQAVAQSMWELRHQALLSELLNTFADAAIVALALKGTAVAYDLYPSPHTRSRGDTDLLIAPSNLVRSRSILKGLGYRRDQQEGAGDVEGLQEVWTLTCDGGTQHQIDLHWQLMNATALGHILPFSECATNSMALPRLCEKARTMDRVHTLIHTCLHRAMHFTSPYFTNDTAYYGDDRLIWANDINLLANIFSDEEWARLCAVAREKGISAVCLDGLLMARRLLATRIPEWVSENLQSAPGGGKVSRYLMHSRQGTRFWHDVLAVPGLRRKFAYLRARVLPSLASLRYKYPGMAEFPFVLIFARRMLELLRAPPRRGAR